MTTRIIKYLIKFPLTMQQCISHPFAMHLFLKVGLFFYCILLDTIKSVFKIPVPSLKDFVQK